jgi:hypothetical protein
MLLRKLSRDDQKPKETILNINKIRHAIVESSQLKEIRIVMGIERPIHGRPALRQPII